MLKSTERFPISRINLVLVSAFLLGALIAGAQGSWQGAMFLGFLSLGGLACALHARRSGSRDVTRLNALEWRDERDRNLAKSGFAVVGAAALLMLVMQFVVVLTLADADSPFVLAATVQLTILSLAWSIANSVVVRRG
jgi:hypothetical protein